MDIIFFAAIAFFIFLKLRKQLGQIDEDEKRRIEENIARRRAEVSAMQAKAEQAEAQMKVVNPVLQIAAKEASKEKDQTQNSPEEKNLEKILTSLDESTRKVFFEILQSSKISAEFFVNGAMSAFEMVIKAFAAGDLETLKFLLSEKIYQGFETAVNQRKSQSETLTTNIIAIENTEIVSAMLMEKTASVVVKFHSKQINYISDAAGQIIKGRRDEIAEITDVWTFAKDITSNNPNWVVSSTGVA